MEFKFPMEGDFNIDPEYGYLKLPIVISFIISSKNKENVKVNIYTDQNLPYVSIMMKDANFIETVNSLNLMFNFYFNYFSDFIDNCNNRNDNTHHTLLDGNNVLINKISTICIRKKINVVEGAFVNYIDSTGFIKAGVIKKYEGIKRMNGEKCLLQDNLFILDSKKYAVTLDNVIIL